MLQMQQGVGVQKKAMARMCFINRFAALLIILVVAVALHAQVGREIRFESNANGLTVTGPAGGQFFRMRITGRDAGRLRTKKKYWFRADGVRFEFFSEETSRFLPTDLPRRPADSVILEMYKSAFLRRHGDVKVRSERITLANGETALFLSYDKFVAVPGVRNRSERETFLIIAGPSHIFGLFAPVPPGGTENQTRRVLARTLGTLVFSDEA